MWDNISPNETKTFKVVMFCLVFALWLYFMPEYRRAIVIGGVVGLMYSLFRLARPWISGLFTRVKAYVQKEAI